MTRINTFFRITTAMQNFLCNIQMLWIEFHANIGPLKAILHILQIVSCFAQNAWHFDFLKNVHFAPHLKDFSSTKGLICSESYSAGHCASEMGVGGWWEIPCFYSYPPNAFTTNAGHETLAIF